MTFLQVEPGSDCAHRRRALRILLLGFTAIFLFAPRAEAVNYGRTAASGDWSDGNWTNPSGAAGTPIAPNDTAYIGSGGFPHASALSIAEVDVTGTASSHYVRIGRGTGDSGKLTVQPGANFTTFWLYLGENGSTGEFTAMPGSSVAVTGAIVAAGYNGGESTLNLNGNTLSMNGYFQTGQVTLNRGGGGIEAFDCIIRGGHFDYQSSDRFDESLVAENGAQVTLSAPMNLDGFALVDGNNARLVVNASLVTGSLNATEGAIIDVNSNVTASSGELDNAILNLYSGTYSVNRLVLPVTTVNHFGGSFKAKEVEANFTHLTYGVNDEISDNLIVASGSFTIEKDLNLTWTLLAYDAIFNLAGHEIQARHLALFGNTVVHRGGGGSLRANQSFEIRDQLYDYGGGDLFMGNGEVFDKSELNVHTPMNLNNLRIGGGVIYPIDDSSVSIVQAPGALTGLSLDGALTLYDNSVLNLIFDGRPVVGLDWGLRMSGDHVAELQSLLGEKIVVSGAPQSVGVLRDVALYGDYTYVGYYSAVPEPTSFALGVLALGLLGRCAGKRNARR